jgi:glycogen operon protein
MYRIDDGTPLPLGSTWDGKGTNFALFSSHATAVDLCLFEATGRREIDRIRLPRRTDQIWHAYVEGVRPGQLYGYRVHGPYEPRHGHRFNPHKLLIDPYAGLLHGRIRWHDALFGYRMGAQRGDLTLDRRDSAPMMPKCVVEDPSYHWGEDHPPRRAWTDTVIYEAHVKGLTEMRPDLPPQMCGTFSALGHPAVIEHLVRLGITAVELMPIHAFADDRFLVEKGLRNYWGYSTLAFFAPEPRYLGEAGVIGLKSAIRALHDAGIEVILDVVYNHTAEGNHLGPTLSLRGIDNASYYKLSPENQRYYWDSTGTGNTLDLDQPRVLQMVMDSLRHWVEAYHIDGFRFDLATSLARDPYGFSDRAGFLRAVGQDPILSRVKLIAEPWDTAEGGYRVGGFPPGWSEWNDHFRDTVRAFWRGDSGQLPKLAWVMTGSREIYEPAGRHPWASINYVSSHDGFTLQDLVSYNDRHNEPNGENNQDGHPHNLSWNSGAEGPTDDPDILGLRARQKRNLLATVFLSQGVPMLLMGDELSRTQKGNNNAYAQDNEISWFDWDSGAIYDPDLLDFVRNLIALRRRHDAFRRREFLTGGVVPHTGIKDVYWLSPEGREMTTEDWENGEGRVLGMQIGNDAPDGQRFLLLLNAASDPLKFQLPPHFPGVLWIPVFDTRIADGLVREKPTPLRAGEPFPLEARSIVLFQHGHLLETR